MCPTCAVIYMDRVARNIARSRPPANGAGDRQTARIQDPQYPDTLQNCRSSPAPTGIPFQTRRTEGDGGGGIYVPPDQLTTLIGGRADGATSGALIQSHDMTRRRRQFGRRRGLPQSGGDLRPAA